MRAIVDRIEGDIAVLEPEDGTHTIDVPLAELPAGTREGDGVMGSPGGVWVRSQELRDTLLKANADLMSKLFRK